MYSGAGIRPEFGEQPVLRAENSRSPDPHCPERGAGGVRRVLAAVLTMV